MRQKDIIKALQNVSEKDAVQLGEDYHGIADIDHEQLLRKVEQRLEMHTEAQTTPESPALSVPAAPVYREPRFPWLAVGMTVACCMVVVMEIGMIWHMQRIAPTDQPSETMTESTTTYYHVQQPFITETVTTAKTEQVTTICTTATATTTEATTAAASSISLQAAPHSTSATTSAVIQTQTESQTTTQQTVVTVQSTATSYVPQVAPANSGYVQTDAPHPVTESQPAATSQNTTAAVTTTEPIHTTAPVQTNEQGQPLDSQGNPITLPTSATTETTTPKPTRPPETLPPTEPKETLHIDDVRELAKRGDDLTWEDFQGYQGEDVGSGICIFKYDLGNGYVLYVGGLPDTESKPTFIKLCKADDKTMRNGIDIRTEDIEAFMNQETTE
jgi:hypothetical protein